MNKLDSIILLDIDDTLFNTEKFIHSDLQHFELYGEVIDSLSELAKIATLGVLSQGEIAFQKKKLQKTAVEKYFLEEHTHIVEYKLGMIQDIIMLYEKKWKIFFIDDKLENLQYAKKVDAQVFTIWIKRGRYVDTQEKHSDFIPDAKVENLQDVLPLIKSNSI